ncbi:MAG TPA: hypothetical protein VHG28_11600 [Longimicrobiaceae bacterium]|nr:hypothetical protein [Longimicrobiaceae bacterium]
MERVARAPDQTRETPPVCVRCGRAVLVHAAAYEVFERMHWLCFHLEFEHDGDPDAPCGDPSCPWYHLQVFRRELASLGRDPEEVLSSAIHERWGL